MTVTLTQAATGPIPCKTMSMKGVPSHSSSLDVRTSSIQGSPWVIQKYGGTSIGKFPMKVLEDIVGYQRPGQSRVAVICSARSDASKDRGTTSMLLRAIDEARMPNSRDFETTITAIRNEHVRAATTTFAAVSAPSVAHRLSEDIDSEISQILAVLRLAQKAQSFTEQTKDFVVSRGEKLSCLFMTALLRCLGIEAACIDLSDLLSAACPNGSLPPRQVLGRSLYDTITRELAIRIKRDCEHGIPIITGFFGGVPGGLLKTVGRGYSDLCAALVAVALGAQELQIWKEVDGVFNADPRKVPTASLLESISPSEAAELSFYGAEVIHPSTMEHVMRANIPIRIKNVMNPSNPGTRIDPVKKSDRREFTKDQTAVPAKKPTKPVAVSVKQNMLVLNIQTRDRSCSSGSYLAKIFAVVEQHGLKVDIISSSEMNISLALVLSEQIASSGRITGFKQAEKLLAIKDAELRSALSAFDELGAIDVLPGMAIISLIGDGLKQVVGISAELFSVLAENDINIEMISQGASETNISAVIEGRETDRALAAIHRRLFKVLTSVSYPRIAGAKRLYLGA